MYGVADVCLCYTCFSAFTTSSETKHKNSLLYIIQDTSMSKGVPMWSEGTVPLIFNLRSEASGSHSGCFKPGEVCPWYPLNK